MCVVIVFLSGRNYSLTMTSKARFEAFFMVILYTFRILARRQSKTFNFYNKTNMKKKCCRKNNQWVSVSMISKQFLLQTGIPMTGDIVEEANIDVKANI